MKKQDGGNGRRRLMARRKKHVGHQFLSVGKAPPCKAGLLPQQFPVAGFRQMIGFREQFHENGFMMQLCCTPRKFDV